MTLQKFFRDSKKKWRNNLEYNFYFQNVHGHVQFELAHALQLIEADSGEAANHSEAYYNWRAIQNIVYRYT